MTVKVIYFPKKCEHGMEMTYYQKLSGGGHYSPSPYCVRCLNPDLKMDEVDKEIDRLVARMNEPGAVEKMEAAFRATPEELGKAAVAAAMKRKNKK